MKIEDRAYPVFVRGVKVMTADEREMLRANNHLLCQATAEMIEKGLVPEGSTDIMAPRKWFQAADGAPDDWLDSPSHGS